MSKEINMRTVGSLYRLAVSKAKAEIKLSCRLGGHELRDVPKGAVTNLAEAYLTSAIARLHRELPTL